MKWVKGYTCTYTKHKMAENLVLACRPFMDYSLLPGKFHYTIEETHTLPIQTHNN